MGKSDGDGYSNTADRERSATAYYMTLSNPDSDQEVRARAIVELKPHITTDQARQAVNDADATVKQVEEQTFVAA